MLPVLLVQPVHVSIHAPLARSNSAVCGDSADTGVSIHAPLARSNKSGTRPPSPAVRFNTCSSCEEQLGVPRSPYLRLMFQYMLLLRGATPMQYRQKASSRFQYMLLLRGATNPLRRYRSGDRRFNTCSSCEEQRVVIGPSTEWLAFQYMLLLRGATESNRSPPDGNAVSIHAPLARSNFTKT